MFSRDTEEKYKIIFDNEKLTPIVNFILKNNLTFDGHGYIENKKLLSTVINDHDGTYITLSDEFFERNTYKQIINKILSD